MTPDRERRHGYDSDYTGPERRNAHRDLHSQNGRRFKEIDDRMKAIEDELRENTTVTREVKELMEIGRSGFKVLGWIGVLAKWISAIAGAALALWGLWHGVKPPGGH